jgi:diacylglycerol O-acyltransferase
MTKDRLSPLDASFLHLEDATSHMHMAAALIFAGKSPPYERLLAHVESRLGLVPRYRQRLAEVPLAQARPRWVDDERFDVRYHLRNTALPGPGSEYELQVLAGRVFSHHLRRDRPLWEMWLVEGLDRGRFAILSKTHHALVDGISGLDILSVLFASDEQEFGPWRPEPAPSSAALVTEALLERATNVGELVRPLRAVVRRPREAVNRIAETAVGAGALAWAGRQAAPPTPYNASQVGPDRRFTWTRASLDDVKAIKNTLGGTVNDVVLTVVTLALRRHLMRRGEDIDELELKAFVPVSVRTEGHRGTPGNQVSGMLTTLPVCCADPVQCLARISTQMRVVKQSGQAIGAQALTELSGFAPPTLLHEAFRLVVTRQRLVNLVVTNVPGPQFPLYLDGRELTDIFPMVPLGSNLNLGIAIVSYNGALNFGLVGDFGVMHDLEDLAGDLLAALQELTAAGAELHGEEPAAPWPGYDQQTVPVIAKRLHDAGEDVAAAVRSYELEHKHRRGVIDATERNGTRG